MPMINVKITPGASTEQKAQIIEKMTAVLVEVLGKNPASTQVIIEEVATDNWGIGGKSVAALRAAGAPGVSRS